jgi:hypothetical protein
VNVQRVFELLTQSLNLCALLQKLTTEAMHLALENVNVGYRVLQNVELPLHVVEFDLHDANLVQAVSILDLPFAQCALLDFDLLIKQCKLIIPPDELRSCMAFAGD